VIEAFQAAAPQKMRKPIGARFEFGIGNRFA
jgi:hypothetical protein